MVALDGVNGTVCNATQYQQFLQSKHSNSPWISCLTHKDIIGLIFLAGTSAFSGICGIVIYIWIGWNVRWYKKTFPNGPWKLFQRPADIYMFSLFVFDSFQATGGILNIRWAHNGIVTTGPYCTTQGLISQTGELGVSLITLILAVHTFVSAVFQVGLKARGVALGLVCLACTFAVLWVVISAGIHKNYDTPTPYWCWINPHFLGERLGGDYIWIWIALFASVVIYVPMYFWVEGFWSIDEGHKFHWRSPDQRVEYIQRRATLGILLYPLLFALVVVPISLTRWLLNSGHHISSGAMFFANSMFHLTGAINVLLLLVVRPRLLLFPRPKELDGKKRQSTLTPQSIGLTSLSDTTTFQHSPKPILATLEDGGSSDGSTPSRVKF